MKHATRIAGFGLLAGAVVTLAAAGVASADIRGGMKGFGGPRGGMALAFADLDANGDGQITEDDLKALAEARFAEADANGDGALDADELAKQVIARMEARMAERQAERQRDANAPDPTARAANAAGKMLQARDADKDGVLSMAELEPAKGFGRMIDRFDTDDDNAISQAEYDEAKAEREARMAKRGERGGHGQQGGKNR